MSRDRIESLEERKVPYQRRKHRRAPWAGVLLALATSNASARPPPPPLGSQAPPPVRVRGQITGLEGNALSMKSREGKDVKIDLADNFTVAAAKKITIDDIKPGDFVGPASRRRPDGSLEAISLQVFPAALRGVVPEGHMSWDLEPGSMMTNATVASMVKTKNGRELTLEYKGGSQKVMVPEDIPMFTTVPGDRSLLVPGAYVFMLARPGRDGSLTSSRVTVSKDGVRPAN
jgi:hypothetical protein